ncbi:Hsp20/alpha crystallin family protein [Streptosporangiaceae bacterium NEAU-GS5]|nr:Hsp20/alpha crystallin family protein [Streptosporangiaceae bacterium NEAU-GS5]
MILPERRDIRLPFPELLEWLEHPMFGFRPFGQVIRVEDYVADGKYVLRAELPGMDPEAEFEVIVDGGVLHIRAEKTQEDKEPRRSEFAYGALYRSVTLPTGAKTEEITATYRNGVLEVVVPLAEPKKVEGKRIAVTH